MPRSPARAFLLGALTTIVVGAVFALPSLLRTREVVAATPVPDPTVPVQELKVRAGRVLCMDSIPFTRDAARLRLLIPTLDGPAQPLRIRLRAPGGLDETRAVPPTYPASAPLIVPFAPARREALGSVCVRNAGQRSVNLGLTTDPRNISRSNATLNGRAVVGEVPLTLLARRDASVLSRLGDIRTHVAAFKPGAARAILWPLALLVVLGVPALVLWSVATALRDATPRDASEARDR